MTLYDLTKTYGKGQGEDMMWDSIKVISKYVENSMDPKTRHDLLREIYSMMSGRHYNQEYAIEDTAKMYYTDLNGKRHAAPYWSDEQIREVYDDVKREIPNYNCWDFHVALNKKAAENIMLLSKWFPGITKDELDSKLVEMTLIWLQSGEGADKGTLVWDSLNK